MTRTLSIRVYTEDLNPGWTSTQHIPSGGSVQLVRRLRIPAVFCALAVLVCELLARPYTSMSVCDDGPYILMAHTLATTGHIVYNGWAAPMLGWQLYLGAAFIKLFGFSFTTVRSSSILVAMVMAFILQRAIALAGITERNATIGTLAFVLSPLYLLLSVTYMTDIFGLFAIVICLYGCLRALQSTTDRSTVAWLCFAVVTNAVFGTARQIAWLGILVMIPSTLWLLRAQRRVLIAGAAATLAGVIFIFACLQWLKHQPYIVPEHLLPSTFPVAHTLSELVKLFLDAPFLLLPIMALFLPGGRQGRPRLIAIFYMALGLYIFLVLYPSRLGAVLGHALEPTGNEWVSIYGFVHETGTRGAPAVYLSRNLRVLLTIPSLGGLLGFLASFGRSVQTPTAVSETPGVSWRQLGFLCGPFAVAYSVLLVPRAAVVGLSDRYLLGLLVVALLCLVRYYQDRIQPQLPLASVFLVAVMAIYGITLCRNTFSFYRARAALAAELRASGIPDTSVDNGWEYNLDVELQHSDFINYPAIAVPAHAYVPTPPPPPGACPMYFYDETPHIHPLYGVSFDPDACYGPAPFAPVHYSRWPYRTPGTLYVVRYTPDSAR